MKTKKMIELESFGYKSLRQIANEAHKNSTASAKICCKVNNIQPVCTLIHGRGKLDYFSREDSSVILEFLTTKTDKEIKNINREPILNGDSITKIAKEYSVHPGTVKKYNLKTREDFEQYKLMKEQGLLNRKRKDILELEKQGFKTLKQILKECGKQSKVCGERFCKIHNIKPSFSFPHARGSIDYYSPNDAVLIRDFVSKDKNELKNLQRNSKLKGNSITGLRKKYNVNYGSVKKFNLTSEDDFKRYVEERENKILSPVTICKKYGIRFSTFKSYNPNLAPSEDNIKHFAVIYKNMTIEERKEHASKLHREWNSSEEGKKASEKAKLINLNMTDEQKAENVKKIKLSKQKNGTTGWNAQCKYFYNGKGYNLTELAMQLEHKDRERIDSSQFTYFVNEKKFDYVPDFYDKNSNQYVEIKGHNFFDENGKFIDPYQLNRYLKGKISYVEYLLFQKKAEAKYQCMVENNVRIITDNMPEVVMALKKHRKDCSLYKKESASYTAGVNKGKAFSKLIRCIETGEVHRMTDWIKLGYSRAGLVADGHKNYKSCKGLHFERVDS